MRELYILDSNNHLVPIANKVKWGRWMRENHSRLLVQEDEVCLGLILSTRFLGLNVQEVEGRRMVFETRRITDLSSEPILRHPNYNAALRAHRALLLNECTRFVDRDEVLWRDMLRQGISPYS